MLLDGNALHFGLPAASAEAGRSRNPTTMNFQIVTVFPHQVYICHVPKIPFVCGILYVVTNVVEHPMGSCAVPGIKYLKQFKREKFQEEKQQVTEIFLSIRKGQWNWVCLAWRTKARGRMGAPSKSREGYHSERNKDLFSVVPESRT